MISDITQTKLPPESIHEGAWFSKKGLLYCGIIIFLSLSIIYLLFFKDKNTDYRLQEDKIKQIELVIDSIQNENKLLKTKISHLEIQDSLIVGKLIINQNKIIKLKQETDEKINAVDTYDNVQLERFFTDRYNKNTSSNSKTGN